MADRQQNLYEQGVALLDKKEYGFAEALFRRLLATKPPDPTEIAFRLAFCLEMQESHGEAEQLYVQVASSGGSPAFVGDALFRIGWMAMNRKDHVKAVRYFKKAAFSLEGHPQLERIHKECLYWLGLCYEAIGQPINALSYYAIIASDTFWFWDVCYRKIHCFDKIGCYQEALDCCREFEQRLATQGKAESVQRLRAGVERFKKVFTDLYETVG